MQLLIGIIPILSKSKTFLCFLFFTFLFLQNSYADELSNALDSARFYKQIDNKKARFYAHKAAQLAIQKKDKNAQADALYIWGVTCYLSGDQDSALLYYLDAVRIYESTKNYNGLCAVENDIGILYLKQKKTEDAKSMFFNVFKIAKSKNLDVQYANASNNMGLVFSDLQDFNTAKNYFLIALNTYKKLMDTLGISYSLDYLSTVYVNTNHLDDAESNLKQSIFYKQLLKDKTGEAIAINNLGELCFTKKEYNEALRYFKAAGDSAQKLDFLDLLAYTYKMQSEVYKQMGDYKTSLANYELYQQTNEKVINKNRIEQIESYKAKYENEKKESEIQQQKLKLSKRNSLLMALSIIFGLALISFYLLYNRYKLKQESRLQQELLLEQQMRSKAVLEAEENERQRIARDLHDGVGQLLSATKMNLNAAVDKSDFNLETKEKLDEGLLLLDDSIKEVRSISHNMMPSVLQENGLIAALSDFMEKLNRTGKIQIEYEFYKTQEERLDATAQLMIYRIVQELFTNITKHAQASQVHFEFVGHKDEAVIIIDDNGIGFDISDKKEGIGLKNIRLRLEYLKGNVDIDTAKERGTTTILEIPYTN